MSSFAGLRPSNSPFTSLRRAPRVSDPATSRRLNDAGQPTTVERGRWPLRASSRL